MEYVEGETLYHLLRREGGHAAKGGGNHATGRRRRRSSTRRESASRSKTGEHLPHATKRKTGGDDGFVKVGDFGLAKIVNADRSDVTSASGPASRGIIGTPEYMAPEQMQPDAALDARADIYALGTIAYHMLGGRPPFTGNITQLIAQKLTQPPHRCRTSDLT